MDPSSQNMLTCPRQLFVCFLLFCLCEAKRCGYRFNTPTYRWGCCWDHQDDVCCPFPLEVVVVGLISSLVAIIVIVVAVSLIKYLLSRWKTCLRGSRSGCRRDHQINCCRMNYPYPSAALLQNYIQLDPQSPPSNANLFLKSASNV